MSTGAKPPPTQQQETRVPLAVMPEGVEHNRLALKALRKVLVPLAVMPEGVEHKRLKLLRTLAEWVPLAVMPEGVEHVRRAAWASSGAARCPARRDAGRR